MKIRKKSNIDWETDCFHFRFEKAVDPEVAHNLEDVFREFLVEREAIHPCTCYEKSLQILPGRGDRTIRVAFGWFCDRCLTDLERIIEHRLPEVTSISVGSRASAYPPPDQRFREVRDKYALFEDGREIPVAAFRIRRSKITTGEFQSFTDATGYITTAEGRTDGSFRYDKTLEPIRPRDRGNVPVHNVSFDDAVAYCDWAKVRLPTEAEWLAAAIIDDRIMDRAQFRDFMFGASGRFEKEEHPDALELGMEWVLGDAPPGQAVVRTGPSYVRVVGWEEEISRYVWSDTAYDLMLGFRVCLRWPT